MNEQGRLTEIASPQVPPTLICRFVSGVDARPTIYLGPGRHLLGRAPAAQICVDDPALDPHHLFLTLKTDGRIEITQISGREIVQIDGYPIGQRGAVLSAGIPASATAILTVAGSRLRVSSTTDPQLVALHQRSADDRKESGDRGHLQVRVVREPRVIAVPPDPRLLPPTEVIPAGHPAPAHTLIAAGIAMFTGLVMAFVLGHMMFAAFALMGAFTAVATWGVGRIRHARHLRKAREENLRADRDLLAQMIAVSQEIETHLHHSAPEISTVSAARQLGRLWARRLTHRDVMDVTLGLCDIRAPILLESGPGSGGTPRAEHQRLVEELAMIRSVPEVIALNKPEPAVVAVTGPVAAEVMRSVVIQLALGTGPADLRIVAVTADPARYAWLGFLPHCPERPCSESDVTGPDVTGPDSTGSRVIDCRQQVVLSQEMMRLDDGDPRHLLLVTDAPELLTFRTGPVRRLLDLNTPITMLIEIGSVAEAHSVVPAVCTTVIATDRHSSLGISQPTAARIARDLSVLEDPEDATQQAHSLPPRVDLRSLTGGWETPEEIGAAWLAGGPDPAPAGVIGMTADAILEIDLVADGPHGLVAGTTGSGKSELLRSLVISLALRVSPEHLQFVLIDYKGGSTFDACADLPHTVGLVTDLDEGLAERALISLNAELHRRERILRSFGSGDLTTYRAQPNAEPLARLLVVIDEFAALAHELPGFLAALVGIAQRGRSLGVHLILATQRPAGVIDDAIRANTDLRIALRLNDASDARDVVSDDRPVGFPRGVPGRSLMRLGADEGVVFQAASSAAMLRSRVDAIRSASVAAGHRITHRPWRASLDEVMRTYSDEDRRTALGVIDDPAAQSHLQLTWDRSGGLVLIGALGSGTTSTMLTIIDHLIATDAVVLHVIDAAGEPALVQVDEAPNCVGVIGIHERERIERLLNRWSREIDTRQASGRGRTGCEEWVLAIDGLMSLRRSLDDAAGSPWLATLERVLAEGPTMGLITVATVETGGGAAAAMVNRFATRWVHHLDDPSEGGMYGAASAAVPAAISGRIFIPSLGLCAQVYPRDPSATVQAKMSPSRHEVRRVDVLASLVLPEELESPTSPRSPHHAEGSALKLLLGIGYEDLEPASVEVSQGDHVMVLGPARSGRSLAAAQIARSWHRHHRDGTVMVISGRRGASPLARAGVPITVTATDASEVPTPDEVTGALLVIVDDAERVDDPSGRLLGLIESGHPQVLVVAVARPEAVRGLYGHWTAAVRRSRTGVMMVGIGELDGDLLSVVLPRRCPIRARPGLAWIVDAAGVRLVQVAFNDVGSAEHVGDHPGPQFSGQAQ